MTDAKVPAEGDTLPTAPTDPAASIEEEPDSPAPGEPVDDDGSSTEETEP